MVAEAGALVLLRRRRKEIVTRYARRGASPVRIAHALKVGMKDALEEIRLRARLVGLGRLRAELQTLDVDLRAEHLVEEVTRDELRSASASDSFAKRWLGHAEGDTAKEAAELATDATDGSLHRTAVTESAEAFNSGRRAGLRRLGRGSHLFRVWDAQLDACIICFNADGTVVGIHDPFPIGEPGAVHPYCRCSFTILTSSEAEE